MKIQKNKTTFDVINDKWFINNYENWESKSFKIIDDLMDANKTFIDIGAWIVPILLYVAPKVKRVIGVDCDHIAFAELIENVNCNNFKDKVELEYAALYNKDTRIYVGGGKKQSKWGSSEITITNNSDKIKKRVDGITIDSLVKKYNINDCGFVKMDIEGGEYIIDSMKDFFVTQKPILYISIHPHLLSNNKITHTISSIFDIFPFVYDTEYNLLEKNKALNIFLSNKIKINNKTLPSNIGHELIGTYKKINNK